MGQYEKLYNFKNLYQAYKLAHRGKINNKEVIEFDKHKIENLRRLQKQIQNKEWDKIFTYYILLLTLLQKIKEYQLEIKLHSGLLYII